MAEQALLADRAVVEERRRIARELHDIVAHSLSVMVVQAGAAQDVVRRDPEAAERALTEIQNAGRSALGDTGRLLHLLRDDVDDELTPPPATRNLPALVEGFRDSGLDVELVVDGPTEGLSAGVDLSVYRIVQESLTNALKHGAGRRRPGQPPARRRRGRRRGAQCVREGRRGCWSPTVAGLIGMRERVAVFGGELDAGRPPTVAISSGRTSPSRCHDQRRHRRRPGADPRRAARRCWSRAGSTWWREAGTGARRWTPHAGTPLTWC